MTHLSISRRSSVVLVRCGVVLPRGAGEISTDGLAPVLRPAGGVAAAPVDTFCGDCRISTCACLDPGSAVGAAFVISNRNPPTASAPAPDMSGAAATRYCCETARRLREEPEEPPACRETQLAVRDVGSWESLVRGDPLALRARRTDTGASRGARKPGC